MKKTSMLLTACGAAIGIAGVANAQPFQLNIAGATLLENIVSNSGTTIDWLNVDGDTRCADSSNTTCTSQIPDQLAPTTYPPAAGAAPNNQWWVVTYRVIGSVNGVQELIDYGSVDDGTMTATGEAVFQCGDENGPIVASVMTDGYWNTLKYYTGGNPDNEVPYQANNPGGYPTRQANGSMDTIFTSIVSTDCNRGGAQIDIAPTDVPTAWAIIASGAKAESDAYWQLRPTQLGYGDNPRLPTDALGNELMGDDNKLADVTGRELFDPDNPSAADGSTVFDNPLSWAPISVPVNVGLGREQVKITELQHSGTTGRFPNGENVMQCTRDSGSGTRNGYANTMGVDPSWLRGENIGVKASDSSTDRLGPNYQPSNKGGSSRMEGAVQNHRLGIGFTGAERAVRSQQWLLDKELELCAVQQDIYPSDGGKALNYNRPTLQAILNASADSGYRIGGPATLSTIGDPRSNKGGAGYLGNDPANTNPLMVNRAAAEYLNNLTRSVENVIEIPDDPDNDISPGQTVARLIIPTSALGFYLTNGNNPLSWAPQSPNTDLQNELFDANVLSTTNNPELAAFDNSHSGRIPNRTTTSAMDPQDLDGDGNPTAGDTYTDGVAGGVNYLTQGGGSLSYGQLFPDNRNRISGDFNGDGVRDCDDVEDMMRAYNQRNGGSAWNAPAGSGLSSGPGTSACIEVLGDFTGDGNFKADDIRYWADGLNLCGPDGSIGNLNRKVGFTEVDEAWALVGGTKNPGGFFNTTIINGSATYDDGDARADVAGNGAGTPGWVPTGADNIVNGDDIDYVFDNFVNNPEVTDGSMSWEDLDEAIFGDLSCDMNGDLEVNFIDVCDVLSILEVLPGDVNLDGTVDGTDTGIATANLESDPMVDSGWAQGDVNGDDDVDQDDLDIIANFGAGPGADRSQGDLNEDGQVNVFDFNAVTGDFGCGS